MFLDVSSNSLSATIPDSVGYMSAMLALSASRNSLSATIPHSVGYMSAMLNFLAHDNSLCGPIPHAIGYMQLLRFLDVGRNSLRGPIPHVFCSMPELYHFSVLSNSLSGTIPAATAWSARLDFFSLSDNQLSGSIPSACFIATSDLAVWLHHNRLSGTLPVLNNAWVLTASGNLLEGRLSNTLSSNLRVLDLSGVPGRSGGLVGPLPPALCQASELKILTIANQQMYGVIPSFTSTLSLLALHKNRLKVLSDLRMENDASITTILLHDNLLSCYVPMCST